MSYTVTKYPQGTFSWADFFSTNIAASKTFYTSLFGWTFSDIPTGPNTPDYTMFFLDGKSVAGGGQGFDPTMPSFWSNYITVDNVDEMVTKATTLGATVVMPPMDVLDSGRMATIADPTGAHISLWQAKNHIGAQIVNTVGAMCWNELLTSDLKKAQEFYGGLFGWTFETDATGYTTIKNNGRMNGGMMTIKSEWGQMPPSWMVYFTVADIDASLSKLVELGGRSDSGIIDAGQTGRIAMVADPAGAHFYLIQMKMTPEAWVE